MPAVHETRRADQQTNRDSHPPRSKEAHQGSAHVLRQRRVHETKLAELERGEIFRDNGVADLIVDNPVESGHENGKAHDETINNEFFRTFMKQPDVTQCEPQTGSAEGSWRKFGKEKSYFASWRTAFARRGWLASESRDS